jgi:threonine synthase
MNENHQLRCVGCARVIAPEAVAANFRCEHCGELYEVQYPGWSGPKQTRPNPSALRWLWRERRSSLAVEDRSGVWRFREMLPILNSFGSDTAVSGEAVSGGAGNDTAGSQPSFSNIVSLGEGNTPLYDLPQSARRLKLTRLLVKHQGMNPTGSFKDTGMTAAISVARERDAEWVACASTGNTSAAMAAYAARAGMRSLVLIPEGEIAWGKLSQAMDYGALTIQLRTDFDGCVRVLKEVVERAPVYLLNSVNPYRLEGQKTSAFEIAEQMEWQVPDHVIVPGGNLANSSALGKGFLEMKQLGLTARAPRISVIQAEGADPLVRSFREFGAEKLEPVRAETRASAIRIGAPASWRKAVRVIQETGGWVEEVSEGEIALAKAEIGAEGIGCEPASAVTLAGLKKLVRQGKIGGEESVVLILTGHTLKDPDYTIRYHRGELLTELEKTGLDAEIEGTRRNAILMDASTDGVLRELERLGG